MIPNRRKVFLPREGDLYMAILAAVGEKRGHEGIIQIGYDLATTYDVPLHVLHVIPKSDAQSHFDSLREIREFRDVGFDVEHDRAKEIAHEMVKVSLEDYDRSLVVPEGRIGDPGGEIIKRADSLDPKFTIVGGRKRTPAGKALFGSVTQTVILDSTRPVITSIAE